MLKASLYERVMGHRFARLAAPVQRFHRLTGLHELHGWVTTEAPASVPARWLARLLGAPTTAGSGPIRFELVAHNEREVWTRHFPLHTMTSALSRNGDDVIEQLGAAHLRFELTESDGALGMRLKGLRFLGLPCPRRLLPVIVAEETGADDRLYFRVRASLPLIGRVAGYSGHLTVPEATP
jgi:hypothetical protein